MSKILSGGVVILFVAGLTLAGFLALNQDTLTLDIGPKPTYEVVKAEMKTDNHGVYEQFIFNMKITNGSISIVGLNHNFFKWELSGQFNESRTDQISFTLSYVYVGTRIKENDNLSSYFIQILLSDGNILTWKFGQSIQYDFIP